MIRFRWMTHGMSGAPGRAERLVTTAALCALVAALVVSVAGVAVARMETSNRKDQDEVTAPPSRSISYYGWYHNVGQLLLHVSNLGYFGDWPGSSLDDLTAPSAEWPAGSADNYVYAAGIWVGGIVTDSETGEVDTLVSAGVYQREYRPNLTDPLKVMYESWEGAANSGRWFDDDDDCDDPNNDGRFEGFDEDVLDGLDNDDDGLVDEDYAAISQQMFRCEYEDTNEEDVNEGLSSDFHRSMGLTIVQESYQWTSEQTDDFVGINFTVTTTDTIRMAYIGFMVDADAGPEAIEGYYGDDRGGFIDTLIISVNPNDPTKLDTLDITLAYMYDDPYGVDGNEARGYFGCMFLGHPTANADTLQPGNLPNAPTKVKVHSFEIWSSSGEDPDNDMDRYRFLRGEADYPLVDGIDNDNDGEVDEPDEWRVNVDRNADAPLDWRFMLSAGPFRKIVPGDTLSVQYAFVMGTGLDGMLQNAATAQQIYNGVTQEVPNCSGEPDSVLIHWVADTPPPPPNQEITAGDGFVRIEWDDFPEDVEDPLTRVRDFYGYQVWKAVGWTRESSEPRDRDWELVLDADRGDGGAELDTLDTGLEGIGKYDYVDHHVKNGFAYWYSVTAYDSTAEGYHFGKYTQNKTLVVPHSGVRGDLDEIKVVPNPYVNHEYMARWNLEPNEADPTGEKICFQNLPRDAIVRIYSLGGELVQTLYPDAEAVGGDACWNMISRNNQIVVSGVYLYHVDSPVGEQVGKFVIIK
ncbi:MAG: hypothetical protein ABIE42_01840 [Candidatus Eisenbacteria bacterium]